VATGPRKASTTIDRGVHAVAPRRPRGASWMQADRPDPRGGGRHEGRRTHPSADRRPASRLATQRTAAGWTAA